MNQRMNERNRLKRKMSGLKRKVATLAEQLKRDKNYDPTLGLYIIWNIENIGKIQRQINALSASVDEKTLLEQSLKRVQKTKKV